MYSIVIANAVIMALDRFPAPKSQRQLELVNQVLSWIFVVEMAIKLAGLGIKEYARDKFNLFDAFVVVLNVADSLLLYTVGNDIGFGGIIVLRSIRLLRIGKLVRSWTSFRILLQKIIDALPKLASFSLLLLIFQLVFVVIGMQFFSGTVYLNSSDELVTPDQGIPPLNNFENLYNATTTVFAIMINDNWHSMMFQYYRTQGIAA
jgi:hypothetical protein